MNQILIPAIRSEIYVCLFFSTSFRGHLMLNYMRFCFVYPAVRWGIFFVSNIFLKCGYDFHRRPWNNFCKKVWTEFNFKKWFLAPVVYFRFAPTRAGIQTGLHIYSAVAYTSKGVVKVAPLAQSLFPVSLLPLAYSPLPHPWPCPLPLLVQPLLPHVDPRSTYSHWPSLPVSSSPVYQPSKLLPFGTIPVVLLAFSP